MASSAAEVACKKCRKFVGVNLFYAAANGKFHFNRAHKIGKANVNARRLKRKVAHNPEDVGIACFRMYDEILFFFEVLIVKDRVARDLELVQRNVGITHLHDNALVYDKLVLHITVERMRNLGKLVGVCVESIVKSCC